MSWSWMGHSHPFCILSVSPPIPEIRLFQTLPLKLHGHGHRCGQMARSCSLWRSTLLQFNQTNNTWDTTLSKCDLEKSKVKVMGQVKVQGHTVHPVSNQCTSCLFSVNRTNHYWDMANSVLPWKKASEILKTNSQKKLFNRISLKSTQVMTIIRALLFWNSVGIWMSGSYVYHADKQIFLNQSHSHDLRSRSCKVIQYFLLTQTFLSQISKVYPKRFQQQKSLPWRCLRWWTWQQKQTENIKSKQTGVT